MKADLLTHEFASDAVPNARGRLLLEPGDALALISRAAEEGVPILALRGVPADDGRGAGAPAARDAHDDAHYEAAVAEGHGCWEEAEAFVRARRGQRLAFEVTLGDDPIEAV